jgi:AraC-like DNA-binding protein
MVSDNPTFPSESSERLKQLIKKKKGGLARWQALQVLTHIELNMDKRLSNGELSRLAGLSTPHFARAFRRTLGETPHYYVMRRRVEYARQLMLGSKLPLSRIAADCGMADQAHFCRLFRRFVGLSPNVWRRDQW